MNDEIFRPGGGDASPWSRVPGEPATINEAGTDGFAVDGTDAFAVDERPVDGPVVPAEEPEVAAPIGRGRLAVIVGATFAVLLAVIIVGSNTGPRPVLGEAGVFRSEDVDDVTTTTEDADAAEGAWSRDVLYVWDASGRWRPVPDIDDDEFAAGAETTIVFDDEFDSTFDDEFDSEFDDEFDDDFDFDDDDESTGGGRTLPRRIPPRVTTPTTPRTNTTTPETDPTTDDTTTTTTSTSTTTTTTTTTAPPAPVWVSAQSELPLECGVGLRVWRRQETLLASLDNRGLFVSTNGGANWAEIGGATDGTAALRALVRDPAKPATYWVAGAEGVFRTTNDGVDFAELGDLSDVRSLSVGISDIGADLMLAGSGDASTFYRSVDDGATWEDITTRLPGGVGAIRHALVLDATHAVVGTNTGVYRTIDGGQTWTPSTASPTDVAGAPVRAADKSITWLLPDGGGVARSTDVGTTWVETPDAQNAISPTARSLVLAPNGDLVTEGINGNLIASSDGGAEWRAYGPACPTNRPS